MLFEEVGAYISVVEGFGEVGRLFFCAYVRIGNWCNCFFMSLCLFILSLSGSQSFSMSVSDYVFSKMYILNIAHEDMMTGILSSCVEKVEKIDSRVEKVIKT